MYYLHLFLLRSYSIIPSVRLSVRLKRFGDDFLNSLVKVPLINEHLLFCLSVGYGRTLPY